MDYDTISKLSFIENYTVDLLKNGSFEPIKTEKAIAKISIDRLMCRIHHVHFFARVLV
jgi:hypothetical protein